MWVVARLLSEPALWHYYARIRGTFALLLEPLMRCQHKKRQIFAFAPTPRVSTCKTPQIRKLGLFLNSLS
jgi:hypothetical protein